MTGSPWRQTCLFQAAYGSAAPTAEELIDRLGYGSCRGQRPHPVGRTKQKLSLTLP